ncbi:MAG: tetratricopeptide repeat protein [Candidatus Omnitrophota bacterium]
MFNFKRFMIFPLFSALLSILAGSGLCASEVSGYLCREGISYFMEGRFSDALDELDKALIIDPENELAKEYINKIFEKEVTSVVAKEYDLMPNRQEAIIQEIDKLNRKDMDYEKRPAIVETNALEKEGVGLSKSGVSGEVQIRLGFSAGDTNWKRANWDLNEKNWRMISNDAINQRENTYDPRIYDRLRLDFDTDNESGFNFHTNIMVDPWSFTGKSRKTTVTSDFGDTAEIELKYWSNSHYTINQTIKSSTLGNSFALPEIKVKGGKTDAFDIKGAYDDPVNDIFHIPEMKIDRDFQPLRELWLDYNQQDLNLRFYPVAYENQALTLDDPLALSNNHIWWEDSPWIRAWTPGTFNSAAIPVSFTRGYWDNEVSFFARDSEGRRLTSLRGFSFVFNPAGGNTAITTSVATPKDPWQEYSDADNLVSAMRIKQNLTDNLDFGVTGTTRFGFNSDQNDKLDARNFVGGADLGYELREGIKSNVEVAHSSSEYDLSNSTYRSESRGFAYYFSLIGRFPLESIMDVEHGYFGIQPQEEDYCFTKFRLFAAHMDESFDPSLSSYVETRDDEWWGRHIHFRKPFKYYYQGEGKMLSWDDIRNYKIGNGIDIGRDVVGLRVESSLWDNTVENLIDVRNVHATNGKFIENVTRQEVTWDLNDQLTTKLLGIHHYLPKTKGGVDPFVFDLRTRDYFANTIIEDGKDPSVSTGSLGLEYKLFDWLAINGIWEYTNDISLAYDNFPRGIYNSGNQSTITYENGFAYRDVNNWLYSQGYFPKPPYPYYNIFKTGLKLNPTEDLQIYLDYTCNEYEKAGQVDDNINHIGLELGYQPTAKLAAFFRYTYSRWQDLDGLTNNMTKVIGHHNFFSEFIYRVSDNEDFTFQYGEASRNPYIGGVLNIDWDPYGGSLKTIDTRHVWRLYYSRRF